MGKAARRARLATVLIAGVYALVIGAPQVGAFVMGGRLPDSTTPTGSNPTLFEGELAPGAVAEISFVLNRATSFAFIELNDSRIQAAVVLGSDASPVTLPLTDQVDNQYFLSVSPEFDAQQKRIDRACSDLTDVCPFKLTLRSGPTRTPIAFRVSGVQGTLLQFRREQRGSIDAIGKHQVYGIRLDKASIPVLLTLEPLSHDDLDMTVFSFDQATSGSAFEQRYPIPGRQRNIRGPGPERILIQTMTSPFMRVDVTLVQDNVPAPFMLRIDPNYNAIDMYQLSLAGTIGAAALLSMCLIASICIILARRSVRQNHLDMMQFAGAPINRGLSSEDIEAGTERKKADELELTAEDSVCIVCLDEYVPDDDLRVLLCGHHFHDNCITIWFKDHKHCPLCNRDIRKASAESSIEMPIITH